MIILYFIIALIATTFGSLVGLGGGVVIKPVLDALGTYDIATIGVLSSFTILAMSIVSTIKQVKKGFKIEKNMIIIAVGSILGGGLGGELFNKFLEIVNNNGVATSIQGGILALLLLMVLFKEKFPKYHLKNKLLMFVVGIILGAIASFLGIGGGVINVMILVVLFNMDIKKSAITSVLIILLSQATKLIILAIETQFQPYELSMLYVMIPGGLIGGFIGAHFNHKLSHETIHKIFNISVFGLVLLNLYNMITA